MLNDLVEFWSGCQVAAQPFVHPDDLPFVKASLNPAEEPASFEEYVKGRRFSPSDEGLRFSLLPVPYIGDLQNASIIVLLLNPGLNFSDYWAEFKVPEFCARLKANLRQSFDDVEYPFPFLDPQFCWHMGFNWWERKLRGVLFEIAAHKCGGRYVDALQFLSKRLACVELVPYHSVTFRDGSLINKLPSTQQARTYVHQHLLPDAVAGKKTLIVARQKDGWRLNEEAGDLVIYKGSETQAAHLTGKSRGGSAILKRFEIA